jgi:AraC-like DNA-binding protein
LGPARFAPPRSGDWAHLVTVRSGTLSLRAAGALVFVTPTVAAWVPEGTAYGLELHARCELRVAYVAPAFAVALAFGPVAYPPLLRELLERAVTSGYLDPGRPRDARVVALIADELAALRDAPAPFALPVPRDPALLAVVETALLARDGEEPPAVAALARAACMSQRTFERRFARETGLAPRAWLRRMRLGGASAALAGGASVTEASLAAGYASLSAFVAAYRRAFGTTPGAVARATLGR